MNSDNENNAIETITVNENELSNISNNIEDFNIVTIQKMIFIYNAIEAGWSVKKIKNNISSSIFSNNNNHCGNNVNSPSDECSNSLGKYEFKKSKSRLHNFDLDTYLREFLRRSTQMESLF